MTRTRAMTILAVLAAAVCGCAGGAQKVSSVPPAPVGPADALNVLSPQAPVNWDGRTGPDGLILLVLAFNENRRLPVTVRGALVFDLYEARVGAEEAAKVKPAYSWRFQGAQLGARLTRTVYGWGYAVRLGWGTAVPRTSSVTLIVSYVPPTGPPVYAKPLVIPMGPR